ncbi:DUF6119 family protein [uncultured Agrobacterium sp.]|uniref:DUF6119 family protein n=1 Tax=uncultured Agrobacterium sp. TaxID=157277 RepID=UPI0025FAB89E|nr:DUF6119 family protein [uncultured Agrobacterium sp.]
MGQPLTLYLCTNEVQAPSDVLSKKLTQQISDHVVFWSRKEIDEFEDVQLLKLRKIKKSPKWTEFVENYFPEVEDIENTLNGVILYIKYKGRHFVVPFGTGAFGINDQMVEADFGLMVTVNEIEESSLRFIDSNNPSAGMKSRFQADRLSAMTMFDIDTALTFIKRLGGKSEGNLGKSLSGSSGFKFSGPDDLSLLPTILDTVLLQYEAEAYKTKGLEFIRSMKPIKKPKLVRTLDGLMLDNILGDSPDFLLCSPDIVEWDQFGVFSYKGLRSKKTYEELNIEDYIDQLKTAFDDLNDQRELILKNIKNNHTVKVIDAASDVPKKMWKVYRCLQGSVEHDGMLYTLDDGKWFNVADQFRTAIQETFTSVRSGVNDGELPAAKIIEQEEAGKVKKGLEPEGEYNQRVALDLGLIYLDKETGSAPGIANQRNELCDLLIPGETPRLLHVKKGSRTSGPLHHLFRQGATASRMLRDPKFLESISVKLNATNREKDALSVSNLGKGTNTIEFRIIDKPRKNGDFDIPFFAKVALHYAVREIHVSGANVALGFITQED